MKTRRSLRTRPDTNRSWQVFSSRLADVGRVKHFISEEGSAGGRGEETGMSSSRVLCHVQRHERPNSHSTALTSANPQLQAEVFVSTAALELACQQQGIVGFLCGSDERSEFLNQLLGRCRTRTSPRGVMSSVTRWTTQEPSLRNRAGFISYKDSDLF